MNSRKGRLARSCLRRLLFPFHLAAEERIQPGFALLIFFLRNFSTHTISLKLEELIFQYGKHIALWWHWLTDSALALALWMLP